VHGVRGVVPGGERAAAGVACGESSGWGGALARAGGAPASCGGRSGGDFLWRVLLARTSGHWQTVVPRAVYMQLVPHADQVSHPM